jgi:hypothetical protein
MVAALVAMVAAPMVLVQAREPNILVIMTDDAGVWNKALTEDEFARLGPVAHRHVILGIENR